jgi:hypothetical protein
MKKKFNFIKFISILLIVGGIISGGATLSYYLIKKQSTKIETKQEISKKNYSPKLQKSSESLSYSPPSLEIIEKKADTIASIINKLTPSFVALFSAIGGGIMLFFNIRKAKREDEKAELELEEEQVLAVKTAKAKSIKRRPATKRKAT